MSARVKDVGRVPSRGAAPTGRKKSVGVGRLPPTGVQRSDDALGHESQNPSSPEGAKGNANLPAGWELKSVGELTANEPNSITDGPFGSKLKTEHYTRSGPRVICLTNIGDGEFVDAHAHISDGHFSTLQKHRIFSGDIVIAALGEKLPRACLIPETVGPAIVKADCIRFKPSEVHSPKFLNYALNWEGTQKRTASIVHGVGRPRLNLSEIKSILLPIAPLPEQRRIVAEIEKQFTRLEAGVAALRRVQANLKRYRAAVLKAACEGRLVSTEAELSRSQPSTKNSQPAYETGEALLARILTERRQNWQGSGRYKEPAAPNTANLPQLPEGWTWAQFGYLGKDPFNTVQTGPFGAQLHNTEFTESGVPVIAVGNLTGTGFRTDGLYFVSATKAKQLARYDVWAGDLLFARSGATLGKVCVAPEAVQDWRMTGHILRARLNQNFINPKIAVYALAALPAVRKQVFGNVRGVTRPGFNTGLLESILIPIPPLTEQTRIVAEVERRLSVVEELEAVVSANLQRASRLRQSILQKAFTGELLHSAT